MGEIDDLKRRAGIQPKLPSSEALLLARIAALEKLVAELAVQSGAKPISVKSWLAGIARPTNAGWAGMAVKTIINELKAAFKNRTPAKRK